MVHLLISIKQKTEEKFFSSKYLFDLNLFHFIFIEVIKNYIISKYFFYNRQVNDYLNQKKIFCIIFH